MINFAEVEQTVRALKKEVAAGQMEEEAFEAHLLELIDVAQDSYYWTFGYESEQWFRHTGQKWVPDDPTHLIPAPPAPKTDNIPIQWDWLIAAIVLLTAIGWVVYLSV